MMRANCRICRTSGSSSRCGWRGATRSGPSSHARPSSCQRRQRREFERAERATDAVAGLPGRRVGGVLARRHLPAPGRGPSCRRRSRCRAPRSRTGAGRGRLLDRVAADSAGFERADSRDLAAEMAQQIHVVDQVGQHRPGAGQAAPVGRNNGRACSVQNDRLDRDDPAQRRPPRSGPWRRRSAGCGGGGGRRRGGRPPPRPRRPAAGAAARSVVMGFSTSTGKSGGDAGEPALGMECRRGGQDDALGRAARSRVQRRDGRARPVPAAQARAACEGSVTECSRGGRPSGDGRDMAAADQAGADDGDGASSSVSPTSRAARRSASE